MHKYQNLDTDIIKNKIIKHAYIEEAKDFILNEEVVFNPLLINKKLLETKEALTILRNGEIVNFDGIKNNNNIFAKANKSMMLEGKELNSLVIFHHHCDRIKNIFSKYNGEYSICDYADSLFIDKNVFTQVENCIDNNGDVKDDASDKLKGICRSIEKLDKDIYNKAHQFMERNADSLQEKTINVRNDRIVFLVKSTNKNKFNGYSYGSSSSGLAYYVEPEIFVELNNQKIKLLQDKQEEIQKILMSLSYLVSNISDQYISNFSSLVQLNVIFAKANYGLDIDGIIATIVEGHYFNFEKLSHPLIDRDLVVSNDYRIYEPYQGIVISGSNTGGKTVSLKAIGLSIVMSYLGIPICADKAEIAFYDNIYIDIDDNQSIENSLSTFSAHITNINYILTHANENSLILIDELISGTDPSQAQAISLAILDKIKQLGSIFIITTHFDQIKNYSYEDENIMLSSVGFNMETLLPTYKYYENSIGSSNALEIASRYFDELDIIENAKKYLETKQNKQDNLMQELALQIDEMNIEKDKYDLLIKENENLNRQLKDQLVQFENEKNNLKKQYQKELNDYLNDIKNKAQEKLDNIKEKDDKVIKEIDELINDEDDTQEEIEFKVGDNVRIGDNEQIGQIISINNDIATVSLKGLSVKVNTNKLTLMPKTKKQETKVISEKYNRVPMELNVVGQRVEDALVIVEEYVDKANAAHMSYVKIIHGIGTGALRSAIRNDLKKISYIKSIKDGDYHDGGSAVTMVEFKK